MNKFPQTFHGIMKSNHRSYKKFNLLVLGVIIDLIINKFAMRTTTRHNRDIDKRTERAQKQSVLTKFVKTYID